MKKELIIELVDGKKIVRNLADLAPTGAPIGAPANDPAYANLCHMIANNGYTDIDNVTDTMFSYYPPSQVKKVSVKFS